MASDEIPPPFSLLFEPPPDHSGVAGLLCGYAADVPFLNVAMERFTRKTTPQRGAEGKLRIGAMLDPTRSQILPDEVPGLLHIPLRDRRPPFILLHAKVAILMYRHVDGMADDRWVLRLIVTTGNWTRQTTEDSIDLFWSVSFCGMDLQEPSKTMRADAADLVQAWQFLGWIGRECCGYDPAMGNAILSLGDIDEAIRRVSAVAATDLPTRFIDNRGTSLLDAIASRVKPLASSGRRDYLAAGSGFFNATAEGGSAVLSTLQSIRRRLEDEGVLQRDIGADLFVNPEACQGVATESEAIGTANWTIRPSAYPWQGMDGNRQRFLHAKFLFSSMYDLPTKAWAYLGSGNLTTQGLVRAAGAGNLEAGVVLRLQFARWKADGRKTTDWEAVNTRMPMQWDEPCTGSGALVAGDGFPTAETSFFAAPIVWLSWSDSACGGLLLAHRANDEDREPCDVIGFDGHPCQASAEGFLWTGYQPRQVKVRWGAREAIVPVVGKDGRVAAVALSAAEISDLWQDLVGFPEPPHVDDEAEYGEGGAGAAAENRPTGPQGAAILRSTMDLVERIAVRQQALAQRDWIAWCARLEQTLRRAEGTSSVDQIRALKVNPLAPLWQPAFRPTFATDDGEPSRLYEKTLARIEDAWGVQGLRRLGATPA